MEICRIMREIENIKTTAYVETLARSILNFENKILIDIVPFKKRKQAIIYDAVKKQLNYNINFLKKASNTEVIATGLLNYRLIYQQEQIISKNPLEEEGLIAEWKECYEHFVQSTNNIKRDGAYLKQPVIIDAYAFAYGVVKYVFEVEMQCPNVIRNQVLELSTKMVENLKANGKLK